MSDHPSENEFGNFDDFADTFSSKPPVSPTKKSSKELQMGSIGDNDSEFNVGDISSDGEPGPASIHQTALLSDRQDMANRSSFIVSPSKVGLGARDSSQLL